MTPFEEPNFTQVPNELFELIPVMKEAELKVVLFAVRKTFGWHKSSDHISISQFAVGTGLSRQGVVNALNEAKKRGILVELDERGPRGVRLYKVVVKNVDQSKMLTSQKSSTDTSQKSIPVTETTSQKSRHTKENKKTKETGKEKKNTGDKRQPQPKPIFDAVAKHVFEISEPEKIKGSAGSIGAIAAAVKRQYEAQFGQPNDTMAALTVERFVAGIDKKELQYMQYATTFEPKYIKYLQDKDAGIRKHAGLPTPSSAPPPPNGSAPPIGPGPDELRLPTPQEWDAMERARRAKAAGGNR
jgi:hypothetical protein